MMYVGVDIGTGSLKAAYESCDGEHEIVIHKRAYPQSMKSRSAHDSASFRKQVQELFSRIMQVSRENEDAIKGIALDGHGPSVMLLDGSGVPATDIITWQDERAAELAGEIRSAWNGGEKSELGYETKALWLCRNYEKVAHENGATLLSPKDYVNYLLTGERATDSASASTVLFYHPKAGAEAVRRIGLPENILPKVVDPWNMVGMTGTDFSRAVGLRDGIPVYAGGIDAWCEALGAGAVNAGDVVEGTGTSTCISLCRERGHGMSSHVVPNRDMDIATLSYTGGSLLWAYEIFSEDPAHVEESFFSDPPSILFLPYLSGERSPIWDPDASGAFIGLRKEMKKQDVLQGVFQGIGFAIRQNMELLLGTREEESAAVRAVGGANSSDAWLEQKAAITGKVYQKMSILDTAPFGSWTLAAYGAGEGELEELSKRYNSVEAEFHPPSQANRRREELFLLYTEAYDMLSPLMHSLAAI